MPRVVDAGDGDAIDLETLVAALDAHPFDPRDEESFADVGPWLARLGRNPRFLGDLAIAELKDRCAGQSDANGYGAQAFLVKPPNGRYAIRANFWPAPDDAALRASGSAAFLYDHAHDHNFPFLTYGYLGPGYRSDDYERDPDAVIGLPGEAAGLVARGRWQLAPGQLMLYRARRDVHVQLPPDAFSVSLNILGYDPVQPWVEQYRFDPASGTIAESLSFTAAEALVTIAARFGGGNGRDLAHYCARRHPAARMRVTALTALDGALDEGDGARLLEAAAADPDRYVAGHARRRLSAIAARSAAIAA